MATVSDYVIARLQQWGIHRIFGYPGDGINGLMGALRRTEGEVEFIQSRHEELAAFMACAHAKFTGEVGVCMATSGPGAIHLLNGLYDASLDHQPVVALIGQQATTALGTDYQQEVDLISLYKDVAHHYVHMCTHPAQARHLIDRAVRIAKAERVVTCVIFPNDIQEQDAESSPPREHGVAFSGVGYERPRIVPAESDIKRAADLLNKGSKVAMLVGAGALGASEHVKEVAELLGAGVAKALLGKAVLPDDLPWVTGSIGLLGTEPSDYMMAHCDTLLMVGTSFPYSEWLPKEGQARAVQIDIKPRMLGLRYPIDVNLHGDAKETLRLLRPHLVRKDPAWQKQIEGRVASWWKTLEERAYRPAKPINPQLVFWTLSSLLPDNCILTSDSGSAANWWARDLKVRPGMMASLSGNLATMGPGVPYALAAKLAHPERPVIACVGDGAMQMIGNNGLITIARHYQEWKRDPRLIVLVLNNHDLNQVTWEQRVMAGDPKFEASQDLPDFGYAKYAELLGLRGIVMRTPEEIVPAWEAALAADRPVVVEAFTDPDVPPMPPHISFEQAHNMMQSIMKGDPNRWGMMAQSFKDWTAGGTS